MRPPPLDEQAGGEKELAGDGIDQIGAEPGRPTPGFNLAEKIEPGGQIQGVDSHGVIGHAAIGGGNGSGGGQLLELNAGIKKRSFEKQGSGIQGQQGRVLPPGKFQLIALSGQTAQHLPGSAAGLQLAPHVVGIENRQFGGRLRRGATHLAGR